MAPQQLKGAAIGFYLGGPTYRLQLHAGHASCLVAVAVAIRDRGHALADIDHAHTSVLPQGRAQWLARAMASGADVGIGMDADTFLAKGGDLVELSESLMASADPWSIVGIQVPQRDGRVNSWAGEGERSPRSRVGELVDAWAVGAALCLYNLGWYRNVCEGRVARGESPSIGAAVAASYATVPTGAGDAYVGEDYWHCDWVRRAGGQPLAVRVDGVKHAAGF